MEYEEMTLDMITNNEQEQELGGIRDSFGCCSKFRQCSTEGKCIQTDDYYKNCTYRKNLESGKVFYGKRSPLFSQKRYDYLQDFYFSLTSDERNAFNEVIIYFVHTERCAQTCLCLYSDLVYSIIEKCIFFELANNTELTRKLFDSQVILLKKAAQFKEKYSFEDNPQILNGIAPNEKIRIWTDFYVGDDDLKRELSRRYIYFRQSDGQFELDEFYNDNINKIVAVTNYLKALTADSLNDFKNILD